MDKNPKILIGFLFGKKTKNFANFFLKAFEFATN
jgi:hypothetical protein